MSHLASQETKIGEPMFADKAALAKACEMLGLEIAEQPHYRWYGRSVGDFPIPNGVKESEMGKNADFVVRIKPDTETYRKAVARNGEAPYEIGMVADRNNPGCWIPMYDYFCGGYGIDEICGEPVTDNRGNVTGLLPKLKNHYDMVCDATAAQEAGDTITFMRLKEASERYPDLVPASKDETTWCSVVETEARVGVR